jgi:xanthine/CO dehydrogenase XdhC/CoxF family maturation factor
MDVSLHPLEPLFERARARGESLVLATVFETAGSTYRKAGAHLLIDPQGEYAGLVSGGCLEGDLALRAGAVRDSGAAQIVGYDMRGPDDQLWGLGAGCEGAMQLLLQRVSAAEDWQPLAWMFDRWRSGRSGRYALVVEPGSSGLQRGQCLFDPTDQALAQTAGLRLFVGEIPQPRQLLLLGAGPDARPVCELAAFMGWRVTVCDHRGAYAQPRLFPGAASVRHQPVDAVAAMLAAGRYSAAVVMSHHLDSDRAYLQQLADSDIPYVGLLGPAHRREKLLQDLDGRAERLRGRLRAPIGLDLGGRSPEAIALAIVGELQAFFEGRSARPFSAAE